MTSQLDTLVRRVREVIDNASQQRSITATEDQIGDDVLLTVNAGSTARHVLSVRVHEGGALLDVDGSQALEFAVRDDDDVTDLLRVVSAFCAGRLEAAVGGRDGKYQAFRVGDLRLTMSRSLFRGVGQGLWTWQLVD